MKNPKVFELIRQLSGKEREELQEVGRLSLLKRPLSEQELRWLDYLIAKVEDESWQLEMEEVESLFPGEGIDRPRLNAFNSNILKAAEAFLLFQSISAAQQVEKDWRIAFRYLETRAGRNLRAAVNKLHKHVRAPKELSEHRFHWEARSHWLDVVLKKGQRKKGKDLIDSLLLEIEAKEKDFRLFILNRFYHLTNIVRVFSEKESKAEVSQLMASYQPMLSRIEASLPSQPPEIQLHYHLLKMTLGQNSEGHFQHISTLLAQKDLPFSKLLRKQALIALRNQCMRFINQGRPGYPQAYIRINDELIAMGEFLEANRLSPAELNNCVANAILCERMEWAENILKKFGKNLPLESREATEGLARARLLFARGKFGEAFSQLHLFHSDDIFFQRAYYRLLCKIYYEQKEYDAAAAKAESFYNHLKHQKQISAFARHKLQNFSRMIIALAEDQEQARRLWEKYKDDFPTTERAWIEQKVEALGKYDGL
jgi:hypothetical protein